ncbi:HAMP domain-containing sensor histidine kinase [Flavivirga aquimarina]|uniref:histidine kinase n=1 Tax=Flavivirga aquimarina TaxID=2027862 RepID=A0ABT8WBJ4_9FLAO|nr:HAMP domain-containing sensor histidine kinase [Flavivirga aquimarina]MDO5970519.1 HAMP domain-containing sensor histidine kinase [Flavivirga aquimarina]
MILIISGGYFIHKVIKQKKVITQLNATKDKLFSVLTHDLKTPMQFIQNKLFTIINESDKAAFDQKVCKQLVMDSYQLSKKTALLMDNTLHWVLKSKDQLLFNRQKLTLISVVNQVVHNYTPMLKEKEIQLIYNVDPLVKVYADLNSLKIIIRNILDNAIKFSFQQGTIILNGVTKTNEYLLCIKDQGMGFKKKQTSAKSVFILTSTPDTDGKTGTGLGLQLCRELTKKNKGILTIKSDLKKGTEVVLTLPLYKNQETDEKNTNSGFRRQ